MNNTQSLKHTVWDCKYHMVWIPKSGRKRNYTGQSFWARGYYVSTTGRDEEVIRQYIKNQEKRDLRLDQLKLF